MANLNIIKGVVQSFVKTEVSFTSVDIANEIKKMGIWIRNREVSQELKYLFNTDMDDYQMTEIKVKRAEDEEDVTALLYHHSNKSHLDYLNTEAKPLNPSNFLKAEITKTPYKYIDIIEKDSIINSSKTQVKQDKTKQDKTKQDVVDDKDTDKKSKDEIKDVSKDKIEKTKGFTTSKRNYTTFNFL